MSVLCVRSSACARASPARLIRAVDAAMSLTRMVRSARPTPAGATGGGGRRRLATDRRLQALLLGVGARGRLVLDVRLAEDVRPVVGDRVLPQHELAGDLLIGAALGHANQHPDLALAEVVRVRRVWRRRGRQADSQRLGQAGGTPRERGHAELDQERIRLPQQLDDPVAVATVAAGDQHVRVVQIGPRQLGMGADRDPGLDGGLEVALGGLPAPVDGVGDSQHPGDREHPAAGEDDVTLDGPGQRRVRAVGDRRHPPRGCPARRGHTAGRASTCRCRRPS